VYLEGQTMNETIRILIVEDLPTDAELATREIRKSLEQCTFQRVETSEGFLEALESFNPDVILSDYHMPHFDGMTVLKLSQAHAPLTPVIIWTGSLSEDIAVECMKAGANNYVIKENIKRLGSAVVHALKERQGWLERKEAENRLRDSEARYRTTLNNMMEGCQVIDFDWRYIYINETAARQGRKPASDLLMRTMMEVYPGIEKTKMFEVLQRCMAERVFDRLDNEFIFPDGSLGWFELSIQPVPEGLFILSIDITERKRAEEALLESLSRFRTLFEASPEAIMIVDPQGNWPILDCNTAACIMNGYTRQELIGQSIDILNLTPGDEAERREYLEEIQSSGVLRMEDFHRRKDGSIFPIELSTSMITINGRQLVLGIDRDITERKQAEEALRESEALYRLAIETAGAVPYREFYPTEGEVHVKYEFIGEGIRQITGYGPEEFNARLWEKLTLEMHPLEDLAEYSVDEAVQRVRSGRDPLWKCDFKIRARDGTIRWVFEAAVELRDEDGISHGSIGIYQDITERKQAEQAVKNSERRLQALIENGQDSISLLSRDGVLLWESPAIVRILGYAPDEFIGQNLFALIHPDDFERIQAELVDLLKEPGSRLHDIFRLRHQDGRWIWVEAVASNLLDEPSVEAIVINYRDVTERRQAEEELRKSAELLSEAQRIGSIGHWEWTGRDRDMICSEALLNILELPLNEPTISQKIIIDMLHPDDQERIKVADRKAYREQTDLDFEYRIRTASGRERWIHQYAKITYGQDGTPVRMMGILQDITERKQAEIQLQQHTADLTLINELNHALNRGDSLEAVMDILTKEARRVFSCQDTSVYLLSPDRKHLVMQRLTLSQSLVQKIERLIGRPIPPIRIPIKAGSYYERILQTKQGLIMSGPEEIQKLIADFVDTNHLPRLARSAILKLIPQIYKLLDIKSTITVPLISEGNAIGMLDLSSNNIFVEEDLVRLQNISGQLTAAILHVQAKDQMQENEKRYRSLFEDSPISLWEEDFSLVKQRLDALRQQGVTDFRAYFTAHPDETRNCASMVRITDVNKVTLDIYGAKNKQDLTITLSKLLEEEPSEQFEYELVNVAEGMTQFEWEGINRTLDGKTMNINLKWAVVPGHEDDLSKVIVSIIDITERKQSEIALLEREARYRGLFEDSPIALREEDFSAVKQRLDALRQDGVTDFRAYLALHPEIVAECATLAKVVDVNKAAVELYRARGKTEMLKSLTEILSDQAIEHFRKQLADIADGQTRFSWEGHDETTDGRKINVEARWAVAPGHEKDLSEVIVSIMDITERKRAEKAIRLSERKFRTLFEIAPVGIAILDNEQKIVDVNYALERITRLGKEKLFAGAYRNRTYLRPNGMAMSNDEFASTRALAEDMPIFDTETGIVTENGDVIWTLVSAAPLSMPDTSLVVITQDISERKQAEQRIQQQLMRLTALRDIDRVITSSLDLHLTMGRIVSQITTQLDVKAAAILLFEPNTYMLEYIVTHGLTENKYTKSSFRLGEGLAGTVAIKRRNVHYKNLKEKEDDTPEVKFLLKEGIVEYYGIPLISKGELRGVMEVFHKSPLNPTSEWIEYLETLGGQAAIAIDNIQLFDGLQHKNMELSLAYDATIEGWSHALDLRDKETEGHTQRVTEMTLDLARQFNMSDKELANIRRGGLLHDIGKMGVPDSILLKPGPLTDEEWVLMRKHPVFAYEMLLPIQYLHEALDIPRYHHEKWDGSGYPYGLKGEQIPLAARIFAVVDIWDAVRSDRPYRPAWSTTKALKHISKLKGTHLDPQVVDAFLESKIYIKHKK